MTNNNFNQAFGPSAFSKDGYMGVDTRTPQEIIKADEETLTTLGLDRKKFAGELRNAYIAAERALGNPVKLPNGATAILHETRGRIPSPLADDGTFQKGEARVTSANGATLLITPLSIHLIEKYGFFQGLGSPFRIDPQTAKDVLDIR